MTKDELLSHPAIGLVLRDIREGRLDLKHALEEISKVLPVEVDAVEKILMELFSELKQDLVLYTEDSDNRLQELGLTKEDLIFQPDPDRDTIMLNPMFQALLVEILQFDGDIPELRTGDLPEGATPAVPVHSSSVTNPVLLGEMLKRASSTVHEKLNEARLKILKSINDVSENTALTPYEKKQELARLVNAPVSIPGYEPGKLAKPVTVTVLPMEVEGLSERDKQDLAHKALTSTQGRRSSVSTIETLVMEELLREGFQGVSVGPVKNPLIRTEWSTSIDGGSREINPKFSYIQVAARSLARQIKNEIAGKAGRYSHLSLSVRPLNTVSESRVGFVAELE
jgi:hypothetical protein